MITIVLPVYNEEKIIEANTLKLYDFLKQNFSEPWQIVISDNKSTDRTAEIAKELATQYPEIKYFELDQQGKGIAIKKAWQAFEADIYCFMDADLATDLKALPNLISAIKQGYDLTIGSRFLPESKVERSLSRQVFSSGYSWLARILLRLRVKDLPCGFKAVNQEIIKELLPVVKNNEWFFDSELVILAEKKGYKIKEIPIDWRDPTGRESRVNSLLLSFQYFKKILEMRRRLRNKI